MAPSHPFVRQLSEIPTASGCEASFHYRLKGSGGPAHFIGATRRDGPAGATLAPAFAELVVHHHPLTRLGLAAKRCGASLWTVEGDRITLHNIRHFAYRTDMDFTPHYYDKTFDLNQLQTVDLIASYWGSEAIAHLFVSFGFGEQDDCPVSPKTMDTAFSV